MYDTMNVLGRTVDELLSILFEIKLEAPRPAAESAFTTTVNQLIGQFAAFEDRCFEERASVENLQGGDDSEDMTRVPSDTAWRLKKSQSTARWMRLLAMQFLGAWLVDQPQGKIARYMYWANQTQDVLEYTAGVLNGSVDPCDARVVPSRPVRQALREASSICNNYPGKPQSLRFAANSSESNGHPAYHNSDFAGSDAASGTVTQNSREQRTGLQPPYLTAGKCVKSVGARAGKVHGGFAEGAVREKDGDDHLASILKALERSSKVNSVQVPPPPPQILGPPGLCHPSLNESASTVPQENMQVFNGLEPEVSSMRFEFGIGEQQKSLQITDPTMVEFLLRACGADAGPSAIRLVVERPTGRRSVHSVVQDGGRNRPGQRLTSASARSSTSSLFAGCSPWTPRPPTNTGEMVQFEDGSTMTPPTQFSPITPHSSCESVSGRSPSISISRRSHSVGDLIPMSMTPSVETVFNDSNVQDTTTREPPAAEQGQFWWHSLATLCPFSKSPIRALPYPPFELVGPCGEKSWVDGLFLAVQVLATMELEVNGKLLSLQNLEAIDAHLERYQLTPFRLVSTFELLNQSAPAVRVQMNDLQTRAVVRLRELIKVQQWRRNACLNPRTF